MPGSGRLIMFLRLVGIVSLLAFAAAVMPAKWIVEIAEELGFDPFPDSPLTFYLARNLSLMYGFVGVLLLVVAADLERYRPLVRWLAIGTIMFGVMQWVVNGMSGLPAWWTLGESSWTVLGGLLMLWFERTTRGG